MSTRRFGVLDGSVVAAGGVLLVAGFLPWWRVRHGLTGAVQASSPGGRTAWDVSAAWWLPVLTGAAAAGLWLLWRLGEVTVRWLPAATALAAALGLALVTGRALTLPAEVSDFGWYAYAPITDGMPTPVGAPGPGLWLAAAALLTQLVATLLVLRRRGAGVASPD